MKRFSKGARVCFVGDSLVASNEPLSRIIEHYNKYFKDSGVRFFNCGVPGGTYLGAIDFFKDDVLSHDPTHIVVAFGVNDSERWHLENKRGSERLSALKSAYEIYKKSTVDFCELMLSHGIELTICTPAPYDEYSPYDSEPLRGGYSLILGYADFIRSYASERRIPLCDYHAYMSDEIETNELPLYSPDRIHPNSHGYYLMAKCFLAYQGLTIDNEAPISEYFFEWNQAVQRLRSVFAAEQMVVHCYNMPLEEKMAMMEERVRNEDWGQAVMEKYIRDFVKEKRNQPLLYKLIDELYERDIL